MLAIGVVDTAGNELTKVSEKKRGPGWELPGSPKVSRATMEQDQKNKEAEKARLEALLAELGEDVADSQKDLDAVLEYLATFSLTLS